MAWTDLTAADPYVEFAEYAERAQVHTTDDQPTIEAQLIAVSRWLDVRLGEDRARPRHFYQVTEARDYHGNGKSLLHVDDFTSLSAIAIDTENDGTYDGASFTPGTGMAYGPDTAATLLRPYTQIELLSWNTVQSIWTPGRYNVRATGTWGWPARPAELAEAVVLLTRQVRDLELAGFTLTLQNLDAGIQMAPGASSVLRDLKGSLGRNVPVVG